MPSYTYRLQSGGSALAGVTFGTAHRLMECGGRPALDLQ
jgi:hypothetical protein